VPTNYPVDLASLLMEAQVFGGTGGTAIAHAVLVGL
jgi:hypothetical protein